MRATTTRQGSTLAVLAALACAAVLVAVPGEASAAACGTGLAPNGTGYRPPSNAASLPSEVPRPGPAILHEPLASAPQLENTGPWRAEPTMVSGTRSYRDGELVYQDFLYDDRALAYPPDRARYAGNAADIVEVRVKPLADALGVRITYNSMLDPEAVAATIALGDSAVPHQLPHGAGAVAPGEVFVTVHGCEGDVVRAADGAVLPQRPTVVADLLRRQVHLEVPYDVFDPRGRSDVRIAAAAGLWDVAAGAYQRPDPDRPAFFNVAFRGYGRWTISTWHDEEQAAALRAGDISPLFATVDFTKLAARIDDDLVDQPGGLPSSGPLNRIHVSHFEPAQGRGSDAGGSILDGSCEPPACTPQYSGRLQPYAVYVPDAPPPPGGYGLVVNLHGAGANHNHFETGPPGPYVWDFGTGLLPDDLLRRPGESELDTWRMLAEAGRPSIMVLPNARGTTYMYRGLAAADVFEVWADAAGRYPINPRFVVQSGSSMGGFGTYKLASQYPDLYVAAFPNIGAGSLSAAPGGAAPSAADATPMLASLRHVPVLATQNAQDPLVSAAATSRTQRALHDLGYRYDFWWFTGPAGIAGHAEHRHYVRDQFGGLLQRPVDRDPRRVTYVLNPAMEEPRWGLTPDHAYWLSGLAVRDRASHGIVDVISHGRTGSEGTPRAVEESVGGSATGAPPHARLRRGWDPAPAAPHRDALTIRATNVATITVDVDRAGVGCEAVVEADTDGPLVVALEGDGCTRTLEVGA